MPNPLLPQDVIAATDPLVDLVHEQVERLPQNERIEIAAAFTEWGLSGEVFGSGMFSYSLRGVFEERLHCYRANPYNLPFLPQPENFEHKEGAIKAYFDKTPQSATSFCVFKYILSAESILLRIQNNAMPNGLRTEEGVHQKAQERQLPEQLTDAIIARAKAGGYLMERTKPLQVGQSAGQLPLVP